MKTKQYIYCLINPLNHRVFYVGCCANPKQRLAQHYRIKHNTGKWTKTDERAKVIRNIVAAKKEIKMKILKTCTVRMAGKWEEYFFLLYEKKRHKLLQEYGRFYNPSSWPRHYRAFLFRKEQLSAQKKKQSSPPAAILKR